MEIHLHDTTTIGACRACLAVDERLSPHQPPACSLLSPVACLSLKANIVVDDECLDCVLGGVGRGVRGVRGGLLVRGLVEKEVGETTR